jgi:acetyltransferase-like isoleucine patch superfamily enzyme
VYLVLSRFGSVVRLIWSDIPEGVILGENVKIGRLCHIDPGVEIGDGTNVQGGVYIPPNVKIGRDCFIAPCVVFTNDRFPPSGKLIDTEVGDGAIICANATIAPGVYIGENAVVGQGANVVEDVLANSVVYGNPARYKMSRMEYDLKQAEYTGSSNRSWKLGSEPQEDTAES